ncbi:MAG: hypothetical protein KA163_10345 [Bacteroidia bacterium]|nr:hypothetical protein [Bacteroidia bacterium]
MTKFISILLFFICFHCAFAGKKPQNIDEAILYFEKKWSNEQKEEFKALPEKIAVEDYQMTTGIWIRSEWLANKNDTTLLHQFKILGIDDLHEMSNIILTSLHRKLNTTEINLEGQVKYFIDFWKPIRICEAAADKLAEENYKKFNVGDSISIYMDVDSKFGTRNAILHECPDTEWSFDYKNDLLIKGIVTEKKKLLIKVKISYLSLDKTTILFKSTKPGNEMEFGLRYLLVK